MERLSNINERVRVARRDAGLSQTELAERVNASVRAVQFWEQGARTPSPRFLRRLAAVTDKDIAWFFEEAA